MLVFAPLTPIRELGLMVAITIFLVLIATPIRELGLMVASPSSWC